MTVIPDIRPLADAEALAAALDELRAAFGQRLSTSQSVREQHGRDETSHEALPDAVVFARSTEEVVTAVTICSKHGIPMVAFGTGTSLEGHIAAIHGGISIDVSQMNEVLEVNAADLDCLVQAGVTRKQLNDYVRHDGLMFPIDPGADASLGGMAATGASGTNAVRYGTMRENVIGLTVVLADGRVVRTGGRARKSSAGYDLTRLMVGSEGTLGIITEVRLRLYGIPEAIGAAVCSFETMEGAVTTVIETIQMGIPVARMELLDDVQMDAINRYSKLDHPVLSTIFFEFHGTPASVEEQSQMVGELAEANGARGFSWAKEAEDRAALWKARHDAFYAAMALRPGCQGWATDVCVPISRLAECILQTKGDIEESGLVAPIVGHVGDGNFHLVFVLDPEKKAEWEEANRLNDRMIERALSMGGTCTGEHGIGCGKLDLLAQEHGDSLPMMRAIKQALDPDGLMNPGKIVRC
ncbi:MAG: FAD-linked oxidase C-terminal domain-containing protein [Kiloniellales bacterium]